MNVENRDLKIESPWKSRTERGPRAALEPWRALEVKAGRFGGVAWLLFVSSAGLLLLWLLQRESAYGMGAGGAASLGGWFYLVGQVIHVRAMVERERR